MLMPASRLTSTFFFILVIAPTLARPDSVWDVDIFRGPAPPPNEGPPLSAGALRDESKLKYEIIGIVGAYLFWCLLTTIVIFFVGKRLRRKTQTSNRTLSMEMIKPAAPAAAFDRDIELGLRSPGKMASLKSWVSSGKGHSYKQSNVSVSTVDDKKVEMDRARNMDEMAKLYAAVIAHDEEKSLKARSSGQTSPQSPRFAPGTATSLNYAAQSAPTPPRSPQYPPEFQHLRQVPQHSQSQQLQAQSLNHPMAPTPEEDIMRSADTSRASSHQVKASPLSFISGGNHGRTGSGHSTKIRPSRISVRGQPISQPIGSADLRDSSMYSEEMPLSPRLYNPGPAPPTPGQQQALAALAREAEKPQRPVPGTLSFRSNAPSNSSNNSLPFRQMYQESLRSAPPTKTTFLDRREIALGVHPKTGVPHTPYSPYTPFTPMTPITPRRLMTREDRKKIKKAEGMKVVSEDDMVVSDEDMWGKM